MINHEMALIMAIDNAVAIIKQQGEMPAHLQVLDYDATDNADGTIHIKVVMTDLSELEIDVMPPPEYASTKH